MVVWLVVASKTERHGFHLGSKQIDFSNGIRISDYLIEILTNMAQQQELYVGNIFVATLCSIPCLR